MWKAGRNKTGYFKCKLFGFAFKLFGMDCYILKYPVGACIPPHTDPVTESKHYRLNIIIKRAKRGGRFYMFSNRFAHRIVFFRPDLIEHSVSEVTRGTRYVLSFGFAIRKIKRSG